MIGEDELFNNYLSKLGPLPMPKKDENERPEKVFFAVKNFDRFQHYKKKNPPWIKLYADLLEDYSFSCLSDAGKGHLILIWILASKNNNKLPYDSLWVSKKILAQSNVDLEELKLHGFIVVKQRLAKVEYPTSQKRSAIDPEKSARARDRDRDRDRDRGRDREKNLPSVGSHVEQKPARRVGLKKQVEAVFGYWQLRHKKQRAKLDTIRFGKISNALKTYTVEDLKKAVDGCLLDAWCMGTDSRSSGRVYNDIELICRDSRRIEKFMELAENGAPPMPNQPRTQANAEAARGFVEDS